MNENLLLDSPYQKVAASPSAARRVLYNLWAKAAYIPCTPRTRVSVHIIELLSALGGFRPKSLLRMKFSQFQLSFITLPGGRSRLVCEVRIKRVKLKRRQKCKSKQSPWIVFTIIASSDPLFDLPDLIADLGITLNAFEADYTSPEDLYTRPLREKASYVPLRWKESMLDKHIVDISYSTLYKVWYRTCLVSGARHIPRFYCLRVGAGGRTIGRRSPSRQMRSLLTSFFSPIQAHLGRSCTAIYSPTRLACSRIVTRPPFQRTSRSSSQRRRSKIGLSWLPRKISFSTPMRTPQSI